jgi:hypothetical protein
MNRPAEKKIVSPWQYAIITAALQAKQWLLEGGLKEVEIRECFSLLELGQSVVARLQRDGIQLPQIDLSYPPSSTAAPAPDIESGQPAAADELEQHGSR